MPDDLEESPESIDRDMFKLALLEIATHPEEDAKGIAEAALMLAEMRRQKRIDHGRG
jgi:hypothetical protein